jgi:hypothetical protein
MRGSVEQLKDAVVRYVRSMEEGEQVNIVLFSDNIQASSGFLTDKEELTKFAQDKIYANGGTAISQSTNECLAHFEDGDMANTLIVMTDGADNATMLRIDSAIGLNEFYTDRSGKEELVSVKRNEGGFVHVTPTINEDERTRNTFECDIVITNVLHVEGDIEKGTQDKVTVKGAIFDFRGSLLPAEFSVTNPKAMAYFEDLGASNSSPVFTKIKGRQISESIVRRVEEESAFGEPSIKEYKSTKKDFVITWAMAEPYVWDDDSTITARELTEAMANREIALAEMKRRSDEYKASQGKAPANAAPAPGAFNF